jgi:hypothetical protein
MEGRFFRLRWRLLALVAALLVSWLAVVLYAQADERAAAIAAVNREEMLLLRIVTSNQAAQIEAGRQMLEAIARAPQLWRAKTPRAMRFSPRCWRRRRCT